MHSDHLSKLAETARALALPDQPDATFRAVDHVIDAIFGRAYTTILKVEGGLHTERVYSTVPETYGLGVRKTLPDTPRTRRIFAEGTPFVANSHDEIAAQYPDHDVVVRLGATNLSNLPVVFGGRVIGLLCVAGGGAPRPADFAEQAMPFAQLLIGPLLAVGAR
jgi:hypothetical protein